MKARIKGTTIIIDVERAVNPCSQNIDDCMYTDKNGKLYNKEQLDIINMIIPEPYVQNWEKIRIKAAIEAMSSLCLKFNWTEEETAKMAVKQADCLVKELKKKHETI